MLSEIFPSTMEASSSQQLVISPQLLASCRMVGRYVPDDAVIQILPRVLSGEDTLCIGHTRAETFVIPILEALRKSSPPRVKSVFAWIVTSSRNLALEIWEHFQAYGYSLSCGFTSLVLFADDNLNRLTRLALLHTQRYIIVTTPFDLYQQFSNVNSRHGRLLSFSSARYLVLYEADEFSTDDCTYLDVLPLPVAGHIPTYVFAATDATKEVNSLPMRFLRSDYSKIALASEDYPDVALKQRRCICADAKDGYVLHILRRYITHKSVVFVDECNVAHKLALMLSSLLGLKAIHIIDEMNEGEKGKALGTFRRNQSGVIVCSALAGEKLNIPHVDVVINYDLSVLGNIRSYFFRIGRAARARGLRDTYQLLIDDEEESEFKEAILEFIIDDEGESYTDEERSKLRKAILDSTWKNISKFSVDSDEIRKLKSEARKAEREARKQLLLLSVKKNRVKVEVGSKRKQT